MPLQDEIIRILGERATHRINFNFGRLRVDRSAFRHVQNLLREGRISVTTGSDLSVARYDRSTPPTLYLWSNAQPAAIRRDAASKGLIVHECVHAFTHFQYRSRVSRLDDEVGAFLAQTIYRLGIQGFATRGGHQRGGRFSAETDRYASTPSGRIFDAARQIVIDHHMLDQRGCTPLFEQDVAPLRAAIRSHGLYS